eukprot:Blabericola_migrator_1__2982@NODE_1862_length_3643_cov_88_994966_g1191_i0_p1_GENE_NODE_1862_length_3643_cov_88_994966_g1191_i0NODE_1862_length_3643_cov_88_994966_g1191_i0_p1_ORF_typecomplete_len442_score58_66DUF2785/PF10978_8/0_078Fanconi_A/PF03511_14/1_2e02Fanconi_A/PF03511_14/3_7e03Fanconi_A/PF03511_14/4_NODE_1862_length_3643_cov_88_994966_g1191_i021973522
MSSDIGVRLPSLHDKDTKLLAAMGEGERISGFCETSLKILPHFGQPRWLRLFRSAVCLFNFPTSVLVPRLYSALEGVLEVRQALAESLFDTSPMRETALKVVQNTLDQIRCAVTRINPWEENAKRVRSKILKVLEQCEALCTCTSRDSWNERAKAILRCLRTRPTPWLWSTLEQLLIAAESAVANRDLSTAELRTLIKIYDTAVAYAIDYEFAAQFAAPCAARCNKLWSQYSESGEEPSLNSSSEQPGKQHISSQCVLESTSDSATSQHSQVETPSGQLETSPIPEFRLRLSLEETDLSLSHKGDGHPPNRDLHESHNECSELPQLPGQQLQESNDNSTAHDDFNAASVGEWLSLGAKPDEQLVASQQSNFPQAESSSASGQTSQKQHKAEAATAGQHEYVSQSSANESVTLKTDLVSEGGADVATSIATDQTTQTPEITQ